MTGIKTVTRTLLVSTLIIHVQIERSGFFHVFSIDGAWGKALPLDEVRYALLWHH